MPDVNPAARVYSPAFMGEATVLGSGLGPLGVAMKMDALNRRKEAAAAKAKADAEKLHVMPELDMRGGNLFQHQVDASAQDVFNKIQVAYDTLPLNEARAVGAKLKAGHNGLVSHTVDADAIYRKQLADAPARFLDAAAVKGGLDEALIDPATGLADIARFDEAKFPRFEAEPKYYNRTAVKEDFFKNATQEQSASYTTASRPGVSGETNSAGSNYYATPANGKFLFNKDGSMVPRDLPGLTELAKTHPKMAAMLAEMQAQDVANGVTINSGTDRINLDQLVRPLATMKRTHQQNNPMAVPQGRSGGSGKAKVGDVQASETSSYELSTYKDAGTGQIINNHFNVVGHSFGSQKQPFAVVKVNTRDMTSLGAGKVLSTAVGDKTNSSSTMNVAGRGFVLEIGGKRSGRSVVPDGMDSHQDVAAAIRRLTPAQRSKAVLKMYYVGSVADKAKVGGDGAGEAARVIGYKDPDSPGSLLSTIDLNSARLRGEKPVPVYDQEDTQSKKLVPATQEVDAQLIAQSPGYDPRVLTRQQAELVRLLAEQGGGGGYITPYHGPRSRGGYNDVAPKGASAAPSPGGSAYRKPPAAARADQMPPARGGSIYKVKK